MRKASFDNCSSDEGNSGYSYGGNSGLSRLPAQMIDRVRVVFFLCLVSKSYDAPQFRDRERKKSRENAPEDEENETPKKRGKKKDIYGIFPRPNFKPIFLIVFSGLNNKKYYSAKGDEKANQDISNANSETDFEKREAVYAANRGALTYVIRS